MTPQLTSVALFLALSQISADCVFLPYMLTLWRKLILILCYHPPRFGCPKQEERLQKHYIHVCTDFNTFTFFECLDNKLMRMSMPRRYALFILLHVCYTCQNKWHLKKVSPHACCVFWFDDVATPWLANKECLRIALNEIFPLGLLHLEMIHALFLLHACKLVNTSEQTCVLKNI